jgi:leucyl aminopeptidase
MKLTVGRGPVFGSEAELLVYPVFAGDAGFGQALKELPAALTERLKKAVKSQHFVGAMGTKLLLPVPPGHSAEWLLLVGLGERRGDVAEGLRQAAGAAIQVAQAQALRTISCGLSTKDLSRPEMVAALAEGALLAGYTFTAYKTPKDPAGERSIAEFEILVAEGRAVIPARRALEKAVATGDAVTVARDLVNMSAHELTPTRLAAAAEEIARASNKAITVKVMSRAECLKLGMGAFLAVDQGSDEELKFIHLTYKPVRGARGAVALIGKGVTFDSGGLSLKPSAGMATMKCDMAGAAAVLGVFTALTTLKPKVTVHGLIAATENMPSGKATRPGDVVRSMNGQTVEILDTDAEGRLTLADAFTYAQRKLGVTEIIDLATLTGACMVALGEEIAGLMTPSAQLRKALLTASKEAGERLWELPLEEAYAPQLKSDIADLKNITSTRYGGAITAGLFLQEFIEPGTAWAHLDIAGPAFAERPFRSYLGKGGTGYGVRLLLRYLQNRG